MGPTWDPSGADRTQVDPMLAPWTLLSRMLFTVSNSQNDTPILFQIILQGPIHCQSMGEFVLSVSADLCLFESARFLPGLPSDTNTLIQPMDTKGKDKNTILTHWGLKKWPTFCRIFSSTFSWKKRNVFALTFVPKKQPDKMFALAREMAWCKRGGKPLSEPLVAKISDAIWRH